MLNFGYMGKAQDTFPIETGKNKRATLFSSFFGRLYKTLHYNTVRESESSLLLLPFGPPPPLFSLHCALLWTQRKRGEGEGGARPLDPRPSWRLGGI